MKAILISAALTLVPALGYAQCSSQHAMSCAEGMVYDETTNSCKAVSS
ncbi:hypothetical protein TRP8649_03007 [Pelagimonas phthalicica]|uniref:Adenylosuccinate lyase n=1 Tax=Pelagimonas phthalicica TaxID=1037362 RepID=A0A238JDW3_9RHOB|nr:hypothetical protein [Pelagimonas phthalicica]TDS91830.1 hypothetical protein CLV87_3008 [Pelagimonas phthalicica]SMX28880.1 hypothetical protein TRP8649_03007 [Pelagimonas phthalicica]